METIPLEKKSALMIVKPEIMGQFLQERGYPLAAIYQWNHRNGFSEVLRETLKISSDQAKNIWPRDKLTHPDWPHYDAFLAHISSGDSMIIFLRYNEETADAQAYLRSRLGAMNPRKAKPETLRSELKQIMEWSYPTLVEKGIIMNGVHAAKNSYEGGHEACTLYEGNIDHIGRFLKPL